MCITSTSSEEPLTQKGSWVASVSSKKPHPQKVFKVASNCQESSTGVLVCPRPTRGPQVQDAVGGFVRGPSPERRVFVFFCFF